MNEPTIDYPQGFIEQLSPLLGDELPDFLRSMEALPLRGVRLRPGCAKPEDAGEKVPWAENAYYLSQESPLGKTPLHEAGAYYLQEPSAMAAAAALCPRPGERVLDLCAAPGGKSTQLAAFLKGEGLLVCNEPVASRAQILSRNIERMGVINAVVVSALPEELCKKWAGFFDKILVDAPCSGEGMFRRHPETRLEWTPASPQGCAARQSQILNSAEKMLRPGGVLAYSTCTFNPIENEGVIQGFLTNHPDFFLTPIHLNGLPENDGMLRLWPHRVKGEGHFVALMKKAEGDRKKAAKPESLPPPDKKDAEGAKAFLLERMEGSLLPNAAFAGKLVMAPLDLPPLRGIKVLRAGLQLGESKGKIFIPDHALALAAICKYRVKLTLEEAKAYQAGETLAAPETMKGFYTPVYEGFSLGWVKISDGQMKNHYPKGLRRPIVAKI